MSLPNFDLRRHPGSGPGIVNEEDDGDGAANTRNTGEAGLTSRRRAAISNGTDGGSWQSHLGLDAGVTRLQFGTLLTHFSASVLFLVFLNSVQPLYISQLARPAHKSDPEQIEIRLGLLTGQLAFADELTSVFMVLLWGALADRIGIRIVACVGYCFVAAGLTCYALATKPWPHLLWCRLMFAIGGSAVTAMLTGGSSDKAWPGFAVAADTIKYISPLTLTHSQLGRLFSESESRCEALSRPSRRFRASTTLGISRAHGWQEAKARPTVGSGWSIHRSRSSHLRLCATTVASLAGIAA